MAFVLVDSPPQLIPLPSSLMSSPPSWHVHPFGTSPSLAPLFSLWVSVLVFKLYLACSKVYVYIYTLSCVLLNVRSPVCIFLALATLLMLSSLD